MVANIMRARGGPMIGMGVTIRLKGMARWCRERQRMNQPNDAYQLTLQALDRAVEEIHVDTTCEETSITPSPQGKACTSKVGYLVQRIRKLHETGKGGKQWFTPVLYYQGSQERDCYINHNGGGSDLNSGS